ncbi:hypothetical protein BDN72DRAFT_900299 [Pluteus cervinus]|uniref:Uncharacterized protein n=1 Tax=Pluteus cervinus TaxID=181527 RepID=A0ACD3AJQ4_9AGAR|nr:hypothetical protein BDN72DRAFT_900299 [Pluteus cervinus]
MPPLDPENAPIARSTTQKDECVTDPSDKFWSLYVKQTAVIDRDLVEDWVETTNGILIFSGLFSAIITAFIIEGYKTLSPDTGELAVLLLSHISTQLTDVTSAGPLPSALDNFTPTKTSIWVNLLWFISLFLSLICALSATLVQQWARKYKQSVGRDPIPRKRGPVRVHLYAGLTKYKMAAVMDIVPGLLHISLFTFLVGLAGFVTSIHVGVGAGLIGLFALGTVLYFFTSFVPLYNPDYPFSTPLTPWFSSLFSLLPSNREGPRNHPGQEGIFAERDQDALLRAHKYLVTSVNEERRFDDLVDVLTCLYNGSPLHLIPTLVAEFQSYHGSRLLGNLDVLHGPTPDPETKAHNYLRFMHAAAHRGAPFLKQWAELCCDLFEHQNHSIANLALAVAAKVGSCLQESPRSAPGPPLVQADRTLQTLRTFRLSSSLDEEHTCTHPFRLIISCFVRLPNVVVPCLPSVYEKLTTSQGIEREVLAVEAAGILLGELTKNSRGKDAESRNHIVKLIINLYELVDHPAASSAAIDILKEVNETCQSDCITAALERYNSPEPSLVLPSSEYWPNGDEHWDVQSPGDPDLMTPYAHVQSSLEGDLGTWGWPNAQDHEFQRASTSSALLRVDGNGRS